MKVRLSRVLAAVAVAALSTAGSAVGHAEVVPEQAPAEETQLFTLAVPNERDDASTTTVVLTIPDGFQIGQFVATPGWTREAAATGSGEAARVSLVTWTAGEGGDAEGGLFQFTGRTESPGIYTFQVEQTYSDGSVVDWAGDEDSDTPAPVVDAQGSGPGGSSRLAIVALVVGAIGVLLGGIALATRGGRHA